jgi:hypothetical protein
MDRHPGVGLFHGLELALYPGKPIPTADETTQATASTRLMTGLDYIKHTCRMPVNHVGTSAAFIRTSIQKSAGHYNLKLPHTSDFEMWLRVAAKSDVAKTEAVQGIRRYHGSNMSDFYFSVVTRDFTERLAAFQSFFGTVGKDLPEAERLHRLALRRLAEEAYWSSMSRVVHNELGLARDLAAFAFRLAPTLKVLPPFGYLLRRRNAMNRALELLGEVLWGKSRIPV